MLTDLRTTFESALQQFYLTDRQPHALYAPLAYSLEAGGKRVRPLLVLLATRLFGGSTERVMPMALAIELFHNFTLLHDDVMDNSDQRRGRPSVQARFGLSAAILSGDAMFALSHQLLARSGSEHLAALTQIFADMTVAIMEGQQYDMDFEQRDNVTIEEYLHMIEQKTAVLLAAALRMGALEAGADERQQTILYEAGIAVGLAFQLRDDYLDVYGTQEVLGKPIGGDIDENKNSWPLVRAAQLERQAGRSALSEAMRLPRGKEKYNEVRRLYDSYHIAEELEQEIEHYTHIAVGKLALLQGGDPATLQALQSLFEQMAGRKS